MTPRQITTIEQPFLGTWWAMYEGSSLWDGTNDPIGTGATEAEAIEDLKREENA